MLWILKQKGGSKNDSVVRVRREEQIKLLFTSVRQKTSQKSIRSGSAKLLNFNHNHIEAAIKTNKIMRSTPRKL